MEKVWVRVVRKSNGVFVGQELEVIENEDCYKSECGKELPKDHIEIL